LPSKNIDKEKLVQQIIYGLKDIGMIERKEDILVKDINDIKYGYVIYPLDYKETLSKIFRFLKLRSIYSIGRYGGWKYATMEDCILDGKIIAEKILYRCG
jgi:protoporphyrinogen oxidase